jgi:hypothetical protein
VGLSVHEASELVGKNPRTIRRWKVSGVDVSDREKLLAHSRKMDSFARGAAHERAIIKATAHKRNADTSRSLASLLEAADIITRVRKADLSAEDEARLEECERLLDLIIEKFW